MSRLQTPKQQFSSLSLPSALSWRVWEGGGGAIYDQNPKPLATSLKKGQYAGCVGGSPRVDSDCWNISPAQEHLMLF